MPYKMCQIGIVKVIVYTHSLLMRDTKRTFFEEWPTMQIALEKNAEIPNQK